MHISWRVRDQHIEKIKQQYLDYVWQQTLKAEKYAKPGANAQILLIHANLLNSHCLGDLIKMYKDHGYKFVSLAHALAHQVSLTKVSKRSKQETFSQLDLTWLFFNGYPVHLEIDTL